MSKARRKEAAIKRREAQQKRIVGIALGAVLLAGIVLAVVDLGGQAPAVESTADPRVAALASEQAPTMGSPDARVHIVEFIDTVSRGGNRWTTGRRNLHLLAQPRVVCGCLH